jgi:hypothetical protein
MSLTEASRLFIELKKGITDRTPSSSVMSVHMEELLFA